MSIIINFSYPLAWLFYRSIVLILIALLKYESYYHFRHSNNSSGGMAWGNQGHKSGGH